MSVHTSSRMRTVVAAAAVIVAEDGTRTPITFEKSADGWKAVLDLESLSGEEAAGEEAAGTE